MPNQRVIFLRNPDAGIGNGQENLALSTFEDDVYVSIARRVFDRVVNEVRERLGNAQGIPVDADLDFGNIDFQGDVFIFRENGIEVGDLGDGFTKIEPLPVEIDEATFHGAYVHEVLE